MIHNFLAIDLGASSGRAVVGQLEGGVLTLEEVHRFANGPVTVNGSLRWDAAALEAQIRRGVELARESVQAAGGLAGIGVDSWGVDYVLTDASGAALEMPYHYRDSRTEGAMQRVCDRLGRDWIFQRTGIQFIPFNTLYQLAAHERGGLGHAAGLLMIADYFSHRLGARPVGEVTLASTSQMLDARSRTWAFELIERAGLPADLLPELVEAGTVVGDCAGVPVIATAAHDTAAAVAGCPAAAGPHDDWAFLSCGTWSLLGFELDEPVLTDQARAFNLGNEAGAAGTTRLLRNIMGLWLLQECRREWAARPGHLSEPGSEWDALLAAAEAAKPFAAVIDPDDASFISPGDMPQKIAEFCRRTAQPPPDSVGQTVRIILEALALKTRWSLARLEKVTGRYARTIHLVGGGVNNRLLCQWTADTTGRLVLAGPSEATAAGNILVQAVATGAVESLSAARGILRSSIDLDEYEPLGSQEWDEAYGKLDAMVSNPSKAQA